jgi:hypothetical protein
MSNDSVVQWVCRRAAVAIACLPPAASAQQHADPDFDAKVAKPAYTDKHPRVLFDEAHHNFHRSDGRYKPFADLIRSDGYHVVANRDKFETSTLAKAEVLVIANALGAEQLNSPDAHNPAFTAEECDAVRDWVRGGGALLLITDHFPTGLAAARLAERFGIEMSGGATDEYTFTPDSGLGDHVILRGRSDSERIKKVQTFTGQSLKGPKDSVAFLTLPKDAVEKVPDKKNPFGARPGEAPAGGRAQAIAMNFGKGRVVVMGEAAMLTAQLSGTDKQPFGMNIAGIDNRQLALNIMHWLSGLIDVRDGTPTEKQSD